MRGVLFLSFGIALVGLCIPSKAARAAPPDPLEVHRQHGHGYKHYHPGQPAVTVRRWGDDGGPVDGGGGFGYGWGSVGFGYPCYGYPGYGFDYGYSYGYGGYGWAGYGTLGYPSLVHVPTMTAPWGGVNGSGGARPKQRARPQPPSPEARARAQRHIQQGDRHFAQQAYLKAYESYKLARRAARNMPAPHFRIAQALVALGKYAMAVTALQQGLRLDPGWADSDFDTTDLYGEDELARLNHLERLGMAVRDDLTNPDLLFLLGYQLHFSGDRGRARPFFERALQLGGSPESIEPFLESAEVEPAELAPVGPAERAPAAQAEGEPADMEPTDEEAPAPADAKVSSRKTRRAI